MTESIWLAVAPAAPARAMAKAITMLVGENTSFPSAEVVVLYRSKPKALMAEAACLASGAEPPALEALERATSPAAA